MVQEQTASAKIYQFPVGGRAGQHALRISQAQVSAPVMPRGSALAVGESWYHAEAIEEAKQATT